MAAVDWTGPIGTGIMAVVVDTDNLSPTHIMQDASVSGVDAAKTQYQHLTAAAFIDGGITAGIRIQRITNTSTSTAIAYLSLRAQGTGENDDRYEARITYNYVLTTGLTNQTIDIYRVVGAADTLIATLSGYVPPAGLSTSSFPEGDLAYNYWKFQAITVGSSVRLRVRASADDITYVTVISASDTSGSRITATGRTRFGADCTTPSIGGATGTQRVNMDDIDVHTLT